jgi:hypothetical protein
MNDKDKEILEWREAARSEADEVNRLQAENKKLREALEFYADAAYMYVIKGVKSEICPCKPDIFEMTYEALKEVEE